MKAISKHLTNERGCLSDGTILALGLIVAPLYLALKSIFYGTFIGFASTNVLNLETSLTKKQNFILGLCRTIAGIIFFVPMMSFIKSVEHSNSIEHASVNFFAAVPAWALISFIIYSKFKPKNSRGFLYFIILGSSLSFVLNHFILAMGPGFR